MACGGAPTTDLQGATSRPAMIQVVAKHPTVAMVTNTNAERISRFRGNILIVCLQDVWGAKLLVLPNRDQ